MLTGCFHQQLTEHLSVLVFHASAYSGEPKHVEKAMKIVTSLPFERDSDYLDRPDIMLQIGKALEGQSRAILVGLGGVGWAIPSSSEFPLDKNGSRKLTHEMVTQEVSAGD